MVGTTVARCALVATLVVALVAVPAVGGMYNGQCLSTPTGKAKDGKISIDADGIKFISGGYTQVAPISDVTKITAGEFAKRRVKGALVGAIFAPVALFALIGKKKREMFAVEYEAEDGERGALVFQVKKRFGFAVQSDLEASSGVDVEWQEERAPKKKTKKGDG